MLACHAQKTGIFLHSTPRLTAQIILPISIKSRCWLARPVTTNSFKLSRCASITYNRKYAYDYSNCDIKRPMSSIAQKKPFKVIENSADQESISFKENVSVNYKLVSQYEELMSIVSEGGGEKARKRHVEKNKKLLVQDRLKLLFDDAEDVLELSPLSGLKMKYGDIPKAGIHCVIGKINGVYCIVGANDATVKAGTIFPITLRKQLRLQEITQKNKIPSVYVVDSGGAFLPLQAEIFTYGGRGFYNEAIANSMDIPQLAIVVGSCTAGAAYVPTMCQEALIAHKIGTIFLAGPPLVHAALGEIVSPEDLGGGKMHSSVSGCTDHFAMTEDEAFEDSRDIVATFNIEPVIPNEGFDEPLYDGGDLLGIIPRQNQHEMDIHQVIARLVDGSRFKEFKAIYGTTLVTGFAFINGYLVGIVGNKGEMTQRAAEKGAHFVELCSQRNIPLIFLQNAFPEVDTATTPEEGEMLGNRLRCHAKLMASVACTEVPKITVIVGNSFGAYNFMMGGKSFDPNFLFTWPNARIGMAPPEILIQETIKEKFPNGPELSDEYKKCRSEVTKQIDEQTSAFYCTANNWDDGMILPQDTRKVLGKCLEILEQSSKMTGKVEAKHSVMRM